MTLLVPVPTGRNASHADKSEMSFNLTTSLDLSALLKASRKKFVTNNFDFSSSGAAHRNICRIGIE